MHEGHSAVLIVGAGPSGCAAGIALARAGIDVCVVDRAEFPRDKTCGDAISNDGMLVLETLGARAAVERGPHALVRRAAAVFPDGTRIERRYDPPGYIVPRYHLDDALRRALEASGARLLQGCSVSALVRREGRVVGAEGKALRWSAQLVIAADGYGSVGLPALGQSGPRDRWLGVSCTAYYRNVRFGEGGDLSDHYFSAELPYGYGWIFPAVDGIANTGVYLRADAYARTGKPLKALMADYVAVHADRFADAEQVGKLRSWSLPLAPRPLPVSGDGLLLVGDAGGFIDPLTGEGIWQALFTGRLAGEIGATAIHEGGLTGALRERYARACDTAIYGPSRKKALVQRGIDVIVQRGLYRSRIVRTALRLGYQRRALEMTKS